MDTVKIGWGRREISIDKPVVVPGQMYLRISEKVHDKMYATALCVDGGAGMDQVIFLSADVATVYGGMLQPIFDAVKALDPTVPTDAIVFNATHTHTGPAIGGSMTETPDGRPVYPGDEYKKYYLKQCAEAVVEAWQTRKEGGIGYGYGFAVVAHSRRTIYFEDAMKELNASRPRDFMTPRGYGVMYGRTNDELFSHYEAGADHFLNVLFTFDESKKLTGMIVNVPCPSQIGECLYMQSSDYWNEVRQFVAKEFGEDVYVLTQCAAAGDLSPRVLHYLGAQERRMRLKYGLGYDRTKLSDHRGQDYYNRIMAERLDIAERIVDGIKDVYSWAKKDIMTKLPVRHVYDVMALERRKITEEEKAWCEENLKLLEERRAAIEELTGEEYTKKLTTHNAAVRRNEGGIERYYDVQKNPTLDMGAHLVQIGDVGFATIRFELYQDFMHRLQARSPFLQTFVVQLAGAEGGNYLATKRGAAAIGYSASMFCNMVSADGGHQWVENCLRIFNEMKEKDAQ